MKKLIFIALLFCFKMAVAQKSSYDAIIRTSADKIEQKVIGWRHDFHQNPELTTELLPSLQKTAGTDNLILKSAKTGSEDFFFYAQKVPGLFFFLGGLPKGKDPKTVGSHHTPEFMIDDSSFKTGVFAICNLVFDYPELNKK